MAYFEGTIQEFTKFVGPYARIKVAFLSAKRKRQIGRCEDCGVTNNLDAAHIKGKERSRLIADILSESIEEDIIKIDLEEFEQRFIAIHLPIETTIRVLCKECHRKYDKKEKQLLDLSEKEDLLEEAELIEKLINKQMNKTKAMKIVWTRNHYLLTNSNTVYSNIITIQNGWWLQPDNDKFKNELHIILNDDRTKKFYFFTISANTITNPNLFFNQRNDNYRKNCSNVYIPTSGLSFKEKNGFDFTPFLVDEFSY